MDEMNKNSLSYKIQKNPFLLGLFVIVIAVALIAIFSLSSAISKKAKELETTTEKTTLINWDETVGGSDSVQQNPNGVANGDSNDNAEAGDGVTVPPTTKKTQRAKRLLKWKLTLWRPLKQRLPN